MCILVLASLLRPPKVSRYLLRDEQNEGKGNGTPAAAHLVYIYSVPTYLPTFIQSIVIVTFQQVFLIFWTWNTLNYPGQ